MKVIINSKEYEWDKDTISYDDLYEITGISGFPICTWSIRSKDGSKMRGHLFSPNEKRPHNNNYVEAVDGMIINFRHTHNA